MQQEFNEFFYSNRSTNDVNLSQRNFGLKLYSIIKLRQTFWRLILISLHIFGGNFISYLWVSGWQLKDFMENYFIIHEANKNAQKEILLYF